MIPLFRPAIPDPSEWLPDYARSISSRRLTNFGPNHDDVVRILDQNYGGFHLPVSSGTMALQIALQVLQEQDGYFERVAIPDFTFAATANAVISAGCHPVIIGCRYSDCAMKDFLLEESILSYDAILAVAPFGYQPPAMWLYNFTKNNSIPMIWDMAGAWPMKSEFHICCYSLHAAKSLPIGEGGLIRFLTEEQRQRGKQLITFDFDENKSAVTSKGTNGKLDDLHCAILKAQLFNSDRLIRRIQNHRTRIENYQNALREFCDPVVNLDYPSLCVLRGLPTDAIVTEGVKRDIVFKKYYYPLLSDQAGLHEFRHIGFSDVTLNSYIAFPSDVDEQEFQQVVDCALSACKGEK